MTITYEMSSAAKRIHQAVIEALQPAEELGGVQSIRDYITLVETLQADLETRLGNARVTLENERRDAVARAIEDALPFLQSVYRPEVDTCLGTGGGCTAIYLPLSTKSGGPHWLITEAGGACVPESVDEPVVLGLYDGEGAETAWFDCEDLQRALEIVRRFGGSQNTNIYLPGNADEARSKK